MPPADNLDQAFERALLRFDGRQLSDLDEADQILVVIWGLEADVNNGGFGQYYYNGAGDQALLAPWALRTIGANRMAEIVARANAVFGPDGPSPNGVARHAQLALVEPLRDGVPSPWDALDPEFFSYPDNIAALLEAWLRERGRLA